MVTNTVKKAAAALASPEMAAFQMARMIVRRSSSARARAIHSHRSPQQKPRHVAGALDHRWRTSGQQRSALIYMHFLKEL
jgi:hypothetical protein